MTSYNGAPSPRRQPIRAASLILPSTGERIRRVFTLNREAPPIPGSSEGSESIGEGNRSLADDGSSRYSTHPTPIGPESPLLPANIRGKGRRRGYTNRSHRLRYTVDRWTRQSWTFIRSKTGQGILKCSLAYLLGSMGTFWPLLATWLGHQDGKHMVATVTVYFHPARSMGSQIEAVVLALIAFLYAAFISFTSMGVSVLFDDVLDRMVLGHIVVLIAFCGGGLGLVGWVKQRLDNPLVNVACSLTSLGIITILTREGSVQESEFSPDKIIQVMKMVALGITFTTLVGLLVAPVSARHELRQSFMDLTDNLGDALAMITRGFLTGSEEELEQRGFHDALARYKTLNKTAVKNLREAKWEHYALGTEVEYQLVEKLARCIHRLAQDIGGLRSAATTQFALLREAARDERLTPVTSLYTPTTAGFKAQLSRVNSWMSFQESFPVLEAIDEVSHSSGTLEETQTNDDRIATAMLLQSPIEVFERFLMHLGPSMKSLAFTLKLILDELPCGPAPRYAINANTPQFRSSLIDAMALYSSARKDALAHLYQSKEVFASRGCAQEANFEEVAASCGYFSFSLLDFAEEMKTYLDILEELREQKAKPSWERRSWHWLKFWKKQRTGHSSTSNDDDDADGPEAERCRLMTSETDCAPSTSSSSPHSPQIVLAHVETTPRSNLQYRLWKASRWLRRDDTRFAIKVGVGAALYALPAFLSDFREIYSEWRGEWGLLSYMLVCSMTIGASNTTGLSRFLGTCLGAICAVAAWLISQGNLFAMAFFGWIMSLGNFYIIVAQGRGPLGRFILLTYNLTALYAYSLSVRDVGDNFDDHDDEDTAATPHIGSIALHRVVAVFSGCLWGLFVTRMVWPISARDKFRQGLSLILLRMGLVWKRDPLAMRAAAHPYMDMREQMQLQRYLARLEVLRTSAGFEFELKGAFPSQDYGKALQSIGRMLDAFHAMNVVITKETQPSQGEADVLHRTLAERNQLAARISHLFQVLASSFKLEFPLNDALPSAEHARERLLAKVYKIRKSAVQPAAMTDEDYALLYAYALVTGQLSQEIQEVVQVVETLFGVLDEDSLKLQ